MPLAWWMQLGNMARSYLRMAFEMAIIYMITIITIIGRVTGEGN